ncbi:hypothetical protein AVEN_105029-1 [Araneus ventricosus]|uniref:Uncharacterized protein n=1 Tax=Araneus ventricosus TaxID=182803 RepID=A0A4Y2GIQ8_ARAVE|nr:hypothetical protein AVEN_105029-1 [Araneus ventricosus]
MQQAPYTADLQSNLRPSGPEVETLPPGHRCVRWLVAVLKLVCPAAQLDKADVVDKPANCFYLPAISSWKQRKQAIHYPDAIAMRSVVCNNERDAR